MDCFNSLDLYFQQKPAGFLSKMSYATKSFAKGETRATLFSVLATTIKIFSDTGIANLICHTDFELDNIAQSLPSGKMPIRVNFILDEFANMPPISSISNKITFSRSRNIRFSLILQDFYFRKIQSK